MPADKLVWHGSIFSGVIHDTIKQRLRAALLTSATGKTALDTAAHLASELTDDGTWPDLPANGQTPFDGTAGGHLERVLLLAKARHLAPGGVDGPLIRALDWSLSRDTQTGDWYHDQLIVPRQVGEIALLCEDELSLGAWGKVVEILSRSRWAYWEDAEGWKEWAGAPLLGVAYNVILRGCLEKIPSLCDLAFRRAFKQVRWERSGEDFPLFGTNPEAAAPSVDSLSLSQDYARFITLAHGTPSQAPVESVRLFVSYLLDFLQWTIRQHALDAEASVGVSSEISRLQGLASAIVQLSQQGNPPRRAELLALAERLQGHGKPLTGHRSFGRSRVTFHQRPAFYSSLRLRPSRFSRHDFAPASAPPVGGTIYYLRTGREYAGMHGRWNQRQLPGLTAVQRDGSLPSANGSEGTELLGCVSEGEFGVGAVEQTDAGLRARKAWFFFDESVACLEAGVHGPPVSHPVFTSVNQCRFEGLATAESAARERFQIVPGQTQHLTGVRRVEHGGFLYYFPTALSVAARIGSNPPGDRAEGTAEPIFNLWIDHGLKPVGARSSYLVLPLEQDAAGRERAQAEIGQTEWLANTPEVQAVGYRKAGLIGVVFWEGGVVDLPRGGRIAANRSCLLLCREHASGGTVLSIANLSTPSAIVHVEYAGRCLSFDLPGGAESGRSLSRQL